ncbi:NTP transferase domain-containing protein [Bacillus sp. BGMRC 2118]|nr:NTP transferase domain-containing protein [Bacillus sp. BGMRC 2118]
MRAIILAAGMGTRLRPLTYDTPKSLVEVNGKPMLEKQIEFMQEKGINEIIIVTGYLAEKFDYLVDKYNVKLIHNDKYEEYNNLYTMYLVREYLPGSYVTEGDVYINRNLFVENLDPNKSLYFSAKKKDFKQEWIIQHDENRKVSDIIVGDGDEEFIMCGVSYWSKRDGDIIVKRLEKAVEGGNFQELFWDHMVKDNIQDLNIYLHEMGVYDSFEIDSLDDLNTVEEILRNLQHI